MASGTSVMGITDDMVLQIDTISNLMKEFSRSQLGKYDLQIVTQTSSQSTVYEPSKMLGNLQITRISCYKLFEEISCVSKPGATVVMSKSLQSVAEDKSKVSSSLEHKLLLAGFLQAQSVQLKSLASPPDVVVKGTKPSWKTGTSFAIKTGTKVLPKVQIEDEDDLIDEDSLLTEEDLKKVKFLQVEIARLGKQGKLARIGHVVGLKPKRKLKS